MNLNPLFFNKLPGEADTPFPLFQNNGAEPHLFSDIIKVSEEELKEDKAQNTNFQFDKILANLNEIDIDASVSESIVEKLKLLFSNPDLKNYKIDDNLLQLDNAKISSSSIIFDRESLGLVLNKIKSIFKNDSAISTSLKDKDYTDGDKFAITENNFVFENTLNADIVLSALINHELLKFTFKSDNNKISLQVSEIKNLENEFDDAGLSDYNIDKIDPAAISQESTDNVYPDIVDTGILKPASEAILNESGQTDQATELSAIKQSASSDTKIFQVEVIYSENNESKNEVAGLTSPFVMDKSTSEQIERFLNSNSFRNAKTESDHLVNESQQISLDTTDNDNKVIDINKNQVDLSSGINKPQSNENETGKIFYINEKVNVALTESNDSTSTAAVVNHENISEQVLNAGKGLVFDAKMNETASPRIANGEKTKLTDAENQLVESNAEGKKISVDSDIHLDKAEPILENKIDLRSGKHVSKTEHYDKINEKISDDASPKITPGVSTNPELETNKKQADVLNVNLKEMQFENNINREKTVDVSDSGKEIKTNPLIDVTDTTENFVKQHVVAQTSLKEFMTKDKINSDEKSKSAVKDKDEAEDNKVEGPVKIVKQDLEKLETKIVTDKKEHVADNISINRSDEKEDPNNETMLKSEEGTVKVSIKSNDQLNSDAESKAVRFKDALNITGNEKVNTVESKTTYVESAKTKIFGEASSFSDNAKVINSNEVISEITKYLQSNEKQSITFQLTPESLGKMKLAVDFAEGHLNANIEVENEQVKQLVQSNLDQLKNNLQSSGIQLSSVNVSLSNYEQRAMKNSTPKKKNAVSDNEVKVEQDLSTQKKKKLGYNTYEFLA